MGSKKNGRGRGMARVYKEGKEKEKDGPKREGAFENEITSNEQQGLRVRWLRRGLRRLPHSGKSKYIKI